MLNIFVRSIILYIVLIVVMRLMGKRQIGELQPFEFAITLLVAELACLPMSDPAIPLVYGIIPMLTLFIVHIIITFISLKSVKFRKALNGKPVIVISEGSVDTKTMAEANMSVNDLLEGLRGAGYFSIGEVQYAILETNGKLSVMPKFANKPATTSDLKIEGGSAEIAYSVITEGKFIDENLLALQNAPEKQVLLDKLKEFGLSPKQVFYMTITSDKATFIQPYNGSAINTVL